MKHDANVSVRISQLLIDRLDAAATSIGLTRLELLRRAIEAECTATEETAAWREHEYGTPAVAVRRTPPETAT